MKPEYINRTMEPDEPHGDKSYELTEKFIEHFRKTYKPEELFDLYEHDREIAIAFTEWKEKMKYEKHANGYYYNELVEAGKQTFFSLSELWELFCKQ